MRKLLSCLQGTSADMARKEKRTDHATRKNPIGEADRLHLQ